MAKEKELSDFNNRSYSSWVHVYQVSDFQNLKKKFGVLVLQFFLNVPFNSLIEL